MECTRNQLLECLGTHDIAHLFNETIDDLVASSSSFSSSSSSFSDNDDDETTLLIQAMDVISSTQYLQPRQPLCKSNATLDLCLQVYKTTRPKQFRKFARIEPEAFDVLVQSLENKYIFYNNSANSHGQIPINRQVLMALIQFGSYGNGASVNKIASLCRVSHGTIKLVTRQKIFAIQSSGLRRQHIQ